MAAAAVLQDSPSPSRAASPSRSPALQSTSVVVQGFFDALNERDISGVLQVLSEDVVHQDLAHEQPANSRLEVAKFYLDLFASLAPNMKFVVEDMTDGNSSCIGVAWHLAVEGNELPMSKGLGFYKFNSRRKICFIRQSPEHFVKVAHLALSATGMASPLVHALGPAATPSFWSNMVDSAASALASSTPLEGMTQLLGSFPGGFSVDGALSSFMPTSQAETSKGMLSFSAPQPHTHATGQAAHRSLHSHGRHGAGVSGATAGRGTEGTGSQLHAVGIAAASSAVLATPTPSLAAQAAAALLASTAAAEAVPSPSPAAAPPTAMTPAGLGPVSAQQLAYALAAAAAASATTAAPPANAAVMPEAAAPSAAFFQAGISLAGEARQTPAAPMAAADAEPAVALASSPAAFSLDAPQPVSPTSVAPAEAFRGPVNLTGIWSKVPELSDLESYERALDLWEINGMQRATARLIEGLEIKHQGGNFDVHHLTVIPYFKVTESYEVGKQRKIMRRDLRSGKATATAHLLPDESGMRLDVSFGAPFPGRLEEIYHSPEPGVMHVTSTVFLRDQSVATTQVYRLCSDVSKQEFLAQSEKRNGKANDILRKFGAPL